MRLHYNKSYEKVVEHFVDSPFDTVGLLHKIVAGLKRGNVEKKVQVPSLERFDQRRTDTRHTRAIVFVTRLSIWKHGDLGCVDPWIIIVTSLADEETSALQCRSYAAVVGLSASIKILLRITTLRSVLGPRISLKFSLFQNALREILRPGEMGEPWKITFAVGPKERWFDIAALMR